MDTLDQYIKRAEAAFATADGQRELWGYESAEDFRRMAPKASPERTLIYMAAFLGWTQERMWEDARQSIESEIESRCPHNLAYYRNLALSFRGNSSTEAGRYQPAATDPRRETVFTDPGASAPVAFAAATEETSAEEGGTVERGIIIKIAGEDKGAPCAIPQWTRAFTEWINRVKDAGVPITVRSEVPDGLRLSIAVWHASYTDGADETAQRIREDVEGRVKDLLKSLPFNGQLALQSVEDAARKADGVEIARVTQAQTKNSDHDWQDAEEITIPRSGFFKIEELNISIAETTNENEI